VAEKVGAPDTN